jgi:hypothetical protein
MASLAQPRRRSPHNFQPGNPKLMHQVLGADRIEMKVSHPR